MNQPKQPKLCDCGRQPSVRSTKDAEGQWFWVHCKGCRRAQITRHATRRIAIREWDWGDKGLIDGVNNPEHREALRKEREKFKQAVGGQ